VPWRQATETAQWRPCRRNHAVAAVPPKSRSGGRAAEITQWRLCRRNHAVATGHTLFNREDLLDSITLARQILDIVEDKQASNIVLLDVHELTTLADYFLLATVDTLRQAKAIEDQLLQTLKIEQNIRPLNMEGVDSSGGGWALLDYGDVIIHLFTEEMREHYQLEALWTKANVVAKVI
jgi:ribosome-associated protein